MLNIGESIKYWRSKKGITQKELAEASETSEISIRKYEANDRTPKPETLSKIAKALDIGYGYTKDGSPYFYEFTDVKPNDKDRHQQIVGRKIKECRIGKMSQKELGRYIGKSTSTIKKYEQGLIAIPNETLNKIASVLDINIAYFNTDYLSSTAKSLYENHRKYDLFEEFIRICYRTKICTPPEEDADNFLELTKDGKTFYAEYDELFDAYQMVLNIFPAIVETTIEKQNYTIHSEFMSKVKDLEESGKIEYSNSEYKDIYKKSEEVIKKSRLSEQAFLNEYQDLERLLDTLLENL